MAASDTTATDIVRALVGGAAAMGLAPGEVIARFAIDPSWLADPDARVPVQVVAALWSELPAMCERPDFGLDLAALALAGPKTLVRHLLACGATLGDGIERLRRFERVLHDVTQTQREERENAIVYAFDTSRSLPLPRHAIEFAWAHLVLLAREHTGRDVTPAWVAFAHPAPPSTTRHAALFGVAPRFDAPRHELALRHADLALPQRDHDAVLARVLEAHGERLLAALPRGSGLLRDVYAAVHDTLERGDEPSIAVVAARLRVAVRTLQRRLAAQSTSFADVLDEVRRALATERLLAPTASVAEVAFSLGFSDQTTFHRAFLRWTGQTPGAFRRAQMA